MVLSRGLVPGTSGKPACRTKLHLESKWRHTLQRGIPNLDLVEPLSRNRLTRQIADVDQGNDLGLARSVLRLLEGFHDLGQPAGRGVGHHTVLTIHLALDRALAQAFRAGQNPVLTRSGLRAQPKEPSG